MKRIITFFIILTFTSIHSFAQADPCNPTILEFPDGTCAYTTTTIYTEFSNATVSYSGIPYPSDCPVSGGVFGCGDLFEPGTDNDDIWFEVTVPVGATELNIFMNWYDPPLFNVANPGYAIYSGNTTNCNSPNYLTGTCDGDCGAFPTTSFSETLTGVTPGDTYLVRVWEVDDQDMNFDITVTTQDSSPTNDDCIDAEDLTGFGCNYGATDNNEPDSWAPVPSGFSCSGGNWSSNENGVWYTFEVTPTTDQPISIQVNGVVCNGQNGGNLQMGIWSNTGTCDLSTETFYECAVGNGTLGINNLNLPVGDYYVFVDGDGGDECTWTFTSNEILPPDTQCPSYLAPVANATACGNQPYNVEIPLDNCPGVVQMALEIITDGYGEELYWYVVNNTSGATILTGGTQGGGSAYADNSIFNVGIGPLDPNVDGTSYTLFIEDSFGDGGCQIIVTDVGNGNVLYDSGTGYTTGTNGSMIPQIFGASSVTVNWTLPDGSVVTESLGMCGTPNRNFTLTTANTCQTETQTIGYEVVCDNDATVLSTGSINVDVAPAIPTDPNNLVSITINPSTCLAEYTYQNDCTSAEMTITEVIAPIAGSSGNAEYTVTYTGPGATDCCSTGGPLQAFSQSSTDLGGSTSAIVGGPVNSPFGGTNNSELLTWAAPGTGGLVSSASFTINVNNYNSNFPITTAPFYWVTVEVDGIIVYDAASDPASSTPSFNGSVTITEADILSAGVSPYDENSIVEVFVYPNAFSYGTPVVDVTYIPGNPASLADGQWSADVTLSNVSVAYTDLITSAADCDLTLTPTYSCCTNPVVTNQTPVVCSDLAGTVNLTSYESAINNDGSTSFVWYSDAALMNTIANPNNIAVTNGDIFYVEVSEGTCSSTATVTFTVETLNPSISSSGTALDCNTTSLLLDAGAGYNSYQWSDVSATTSQTLSVTTMGTYTVTVSSSNGCTASTSVTISQNITSPTADIQASTLTLDCNNASSTLDASGSSGTGTISYAWSDSSTNPTLAVNAPGTYTVVITDSANGCTASNSVTVIENPPLVITNLQENCDASNTNYTVTFNISGGSGSYLVNSVAISGSTYTSTPIASGSAYNFMIEDDQGCPAAIQSGMLVCTPNFCSSSTGCFGPNLITNGDFETGNTGFTSDYDYSSCPGTICTNSTTGQPILCQYDYGIGTNPSDCNADWPSSIVDHTSGSGNMMIVDFPAGDVSPNNNIWCQMVTVTPNTDYCFSAHFINLLSTGSNQPEPIFEFTVDGVLIGTTTSIGETEQWENQGFQFNSNANTNVEICIRNNNFGNVGFDLAIDDITLSSINTGTPPSLVADAGIICGNDTDITIDVASNDMPLANLDLNTLSIEVAPPFSEGSITAIDQVNGTITFTPSAGFSGATSFEYQLCDNSGCCSTAMVNITSGNNPSISGTAADITCLPSSGMIDITVSGGMPGYTYDWSDDAFDGMDDITVSTSGTYTITVSDMNGCSASNSFTVADNDDMPMANVSSLVSVLDCNNTMISLDASGSSVTGTISYTWSDMSTNPTLDVSTPGTYTVIITDTDNGCTASTSSTITQNIATPTASISPTGTMLDCTTTSVNLDASGSSGAGTLSYLWSDNSSNAILTVGTAGTYTVIVTDDANGCTSSSSVTVNQDPSVPSAVINAPYWVLDCNNANVTLDASASSGTGTITYEWNDMSTNSTLNVSTPGSYTVVITDSANGCSASTSVTITEDTAAPMTNLVSNNMTLDCNNSSATLDASGSTGTGTISYVWNDLSTNPTLTTSTAGTYTVIISDSANGCTASSSMTISQDITAPIADIAASTLTLDCNNSSTTLDASGSSGTGTISYEWSDMSINSTLTTSTAGIYTVIISDSANGCTASTSITIGQDIAITTPTIAASATEFDCNVSSIDLDAGAGYASYLWSDNSSSQMISITNPGDYTVIVSTANGCTASSSITVGSSATLTASITGDLSICPQGGNTTLDASNPNATSYLWSNNETGASISVNIPGIYSVTISDGICDAQTSVTVIASNAPSPTITGDNSICAGTPGSLDAGGGYSNYLWSSGETSQTIAVSSASTYTVTVTNGDGCTGTDSHIVTETSPPIYEIIDNTTICIGGNIAIGTIEAQGVTYSWTANPADPSLVDPNIGIPTVSPTVTTTYTLTASQGTCVAIESVIITVEDPMVNTSNVTTCPGEGAMLSASGSPSGGTYTWADWQGNQIGTGSDFEVNPFTSTSYFVTYTVNGCNVSEVVLVDVLDNPSISIDASATEIILGENATLTVLDAPVGSTFNWIESGLEQLPDEGSVVINPTESTTYTVEVTTPDGCIYYASISILVETPSEIEIPNIFTPNGDDLNDEFYIADGNLNYDVIEFKVFDRWGEVVHDNPGNGWNGTHNGKALPSDIYIYLFRVRNLNGKIDTMKGDVALVR